MQTSGYRIGQAIMAIDIFELLRNIRCIWNNLVIFSFIMSFRCLSDRIFVILGIWLVFEDIYVFLRFYENCI